MLEKIGLPPKPSLRGNNWVVDASHCQQCSSQFTFINRKHHCRRCGGLFCNSCTQQRMMLRGQGDSPVRICDPCKKLEEAARYEMRYGHKNRAAKGGSKLALKKEDEASNGSSSNIPEIAVQAEGGEITRNLSLDQSINILTEVGSATPEDLREQAILEKKKYKTLKADGKSEEALRAFKRGKELEREAAALEISLRKNRRKALSSSNMGDTQQIKDDSMLSSGKSNLSAQKSKAKDDISAELKELGWSDMDVHDAEKKPATLSLEGELSSLLREVSQKPNKEKGVITTDKSQVILHKKRALELKRAGNLVEAKEELKRAKILERKIEEEELLGGDDYESDDELSSLIRSIDADDHDDLPAAYKSDLGFNFDHFVSGADDLVMDGNFEVTEDDMDDPEIASALTSLGWTEDTRNNNLEDFKEQTAPSSNESLLSEIQSIKRKALTQKRAGNTAEAMALLKKAKVLERELESSDIVQKSPVPQSSEDPLLSARVNVENVKPTDYKGVKLAPKTKLTIQKELIALKKKALSLRREGKLAESDEELEKAKVLEQQLEDMNKASTVTQENTDKQQAHNSMHVTLSDETQEEVTDQDLHDPAYLSLLKNLGWDDEDALKVPSTISKDDNRTSTTDSSATQYIDTGTSRKSKSQIQREMLVLKRKALTLRREGEVEEAEEVLKMTRSLEAQLQEYEEPTQREEVSAENTKGNASTDAPQKKGSSLQVDLHDAPRTGDSVNQDKIGLQTPEKMVRENEKPYIQEVSSSDATASQPISSTIQQEILAHKRKAVSLKREGKLAEAKEELRQAKLLEKQMEEETSQTSSKSTDASASSADKAGSPSSVSKPMSSRDRFKMQQQSLGHKRQALKLRREGRTAEADAEFELAKALESQLQELDSHDSTVSSRPVDDVGVEDFLDPQLLSALQSLGLGESPTQTPNAERRESTKSHQDNIHGTEIEREQLAERIKAEKVKAVNLKRAGKQAEALDSLRLAKQYEKKLQSLTSI